PAKPGFLYTAEGRNFGRNQAVVHADNSVFERFGDTPNAGDVSPVEIGGKAEFGVVCKGDGVGFRLEAEKRRDGAKSLFPRHSHLRGDVSKNGGLKESAAE